MKQFFLLAAVLPLSCSSEPDNFRLARVFGDNMVLQRDIAIPVWGWAKPGRKVKVTLAGKEAQTAAGNDGRWRVNLPAVPAGGPYELKASGDSDLVIRNVLVGDVFLCAGGSNLELPVDAVENASKEIAAAQFPAIRHFTVPKGMSRSPLEDIPLASWQECKPSTVSAWTATGYFFARAIHQRLHVPVGILNASWGGTTCEAWSSVQALESLPEFKGLASRLAGPAPVDLRSHEERLAQWKKSLELADLGSQPNQKSWADPTLDDSSWKTMEAPQYWERGELPDFDGMVWFRKKVFIPSAWGAHDLRISLGPIDDEDITYWNGVRVGATEGWNTPRSYRIPASEVKIGPNLLAVRVNDTGGGGGFHGTPKEMVVEGPDIPLAGTWSYAIGMDLAQHPPPSLPEFSGNPRSPSGNFNSMIAPLVPFGIKGVVWYQGEANVGGADGYRLLFPLLIRDWRARWEQGDFPFLFVQLANLKAASPAPSESALAELRESQAVGLTYSNTGMAVTIDIGEAGNPHPANKQEVGRRLARWLDVDPKGAKLVPMGPLYEFSSVEDQSVRIKYKHFGAGLVARGGPLKGFAIAGEDRQWFWADAKIDGNTVVVSSPKVARPSSVRYAWADNPEGCNLYNEEGFPAAPFRTGF